MLVCLTLELVALAVWVGGLLVLIGAVIPLRADAPDESLGLDMSMHGEEAYVHMGGSANV